MVSFSHIFSKHHHELCDNYAEHHYHSKAVDCDLHKFHKNPALKIELPTYELVLEDAGSKLYYNYYDFLNDFEPLPFDLRGPPAFV